MAPLYPSTTLVGSWAGLPTAFPFGSSSSQTALDHSKGRRCSDALSNGRGRLLAPHQSNPASMHVSSLMAGNLPASAIRRSSRPFIPAHCHGANRRSAHTLPVEQVFQGIAHRITVHLSNVLSKASLRPDQLGRSGCEWRPLISVMRCPT